MPLDVTTEQTDEGYTILSVLGEVDMVSAPEFQDYLTQAIEGNSPVIVDLSNIDFIDSSGLRELHRAADQGTVVVVTGPNALVSRIADLTRLGSILLVCDGVAAAKQRLLEERTQREGSDD